MLDRTTNSPWAPALLLLCEPPPSCLRANLFWHSHSQAFLSYSPFRPLKSLNLKSPNVLTDSEERSLSALRFSTSATRCGTNLLLFPSIHNLEKSRHSVRSRTNNSSDWPDPCPTDRVEFPAQYFLKISNIFRHNNLSGRCEKGGHY